MLREVKSIKLFLGVDYRNEGGGQYLDEDGEWKPTPEGWYYLCNSYDFIEKKDINTDFSTLMNVDTADFENPEAVKNPVLILNLLKKYNDEQLKLLCSEFEYWKDKMELSSLPNPRIQSIVNFYETILYEFQYWYEKFKFSIPVGCNHPILDSLMRTDEDIAVVTSEERTTEITPAASIDKNENSIDYNSDARIYLKAALEAHPKKPTLEKLEKISKGSHKGKRSIPTWSRRWRDTTFLMALINLLNAKIKIEESKNTKEHDKLQFIKSYVIEKLAMCTKLKSQEMFDKSRKEPNVNVEDIGIPPEPTN